MKEIRVGHIDISALNTPPEKHEYETAKYFARRYKDIVFIKPSSIKGQHTPDFLMCGKMWEIKCPLVYSKSSFEDIFRKATKQSCHIIFDLRRLRKSDVRIYVYNITKRSKSQKIKTLLVITSDGQLLTIKGRFDIIKS